MKLIIVLCRSQQEVSYSEIVKALQFYVVHSFDPFLSVHLCIMS